MEPFSIVRKKGPTGSADLVATDLYGKEVGRVTVHSVAPAWWGETRLVYSGDKETFFKLASQQKLELQEKIDSDEKCQ